MIKEAFNDMLVSVDEIKSSESEIADDLFKKIRQRYNQNVKSKGPSVVSMETK